MKNKITLCILFLCFCLAVPATSFAAGRVDADINSSGCGIGYYRGETKVQATDTNVTKLFGWNSVKNVEGDYSVGSGSSEGTSSPHYTYTNCFAGTPGYWYQSKATGAYNNGTTLKNLGDDVHDFVA